MKRTVFWALVVINAVLLAALLAPYMKSSEALAQRAAGRRPELLMIPGEVIGGNSAAVYLVDTNNRRLGAIMLNNKGNGLDVLEPQPLDRIFDDRAAKDDAVPKGGRK
jgi:hypothetical protein